MLLRILDFVRLSSTNENCTDPSLRDLKSSFAVTVLSPDVAVWINPHAVFFEELVRWLNTLFLSVYQATDLDEITTTLNDIVNQLDPELG